PRPSTGSLTFSCNSHSRIEGTLALTRGGAPAPGQGEKPSCQGIPSPSLMRRDCARSEGLPCARRWYQASGTPIVRPSTSFTTNVSSVTGTPCSSFVLEEEVAIWLFFPERRSVGWT